MLTWLALLPAASAHLPHVPIVDAVRTAEGTVVLAISDSRQGSYEVLLRETEGAWTGITMPPYLALPAGVATMGDDLVLVTEDGVVFRGSSGGWVELARVQLGAVVQVDGNDDGVWLDTSEGLVLVDERGDGTTLVNGPLVSFSATDAGAAWVSAEGVGAYYDGAITALDVPDNVDLVTLAIGETGEREVWAAGQDGISWVDADGGVNACGALPISDEEAQYAGYVTRLIVGERVIVLTGQQAYVSDDRCATWTEEVISPTFHYGEVGDVERPIEAWVGAEEEPLRFYGHPGVVSQAGDHFDVSGLLSCGISHALASTDAGGLWVGTYGGGVYSLDPAAQEVKWRDPALDHQELFVQSIGANGDKALATYDVGAMTYGLDDIEGWKFSVTGLAWPSDVQWVDGRWWVSSRGGEAVGAVTTSDMVAFETPAGLADVVDASEFVRIQATPGALWAVTEPAGIYRSVDGGESWELVNPDMEFASLVGADSGALFGVQDGIMFTSPDAGATWTPVPGHDGVVAMAAVRDTVALLQSNGDVWVSSDGGQGFDAWGQPTAGGVFAMALVPAASDVVAVSTLEGISWSDGSGWRQAPSLMRASAQSGVVRCYAADGPPCLSADTDSAWTVSIGQTFEWTVFGDTFSFKGSPGTVLRVYDQDVDLGDVQPGEALSLGASGWHPLHLESVEGDPVDGGISWLQAATPGEWYDPPLVHDTAETGDTAGAGDEGCGHGCGGGAALLLLLPVLGAGRRFGGRP